MSASPPVPAPASRPEPLQVRPLPDEAVPTRFGRALVVLRKLIVYGKQLATSLQQRTATNLDDITHCFGTLDVALIIARIVRALQRAAELEVRLVARVDREAHAAAAHPRAAADRRPRATPPATPRAPGPAGNVARMPTPEDIAAALRRRPIGAVIADICRDLGIMPSDPLWREVTWVIGENGGNVTALFKSILLRPRLPLVVPPDWVVPAWFTEAYTGVRAPSGTGPP